MSKTCEQCGRPASLTDAALRGGRWVTVDLCADCANKRRQTAAIPALGAALGAAALLAGGAYMIERMTRETRELGRTPNQLEHLCRSFCIISNGSNRAAGTLAELTANPRSTTGRFLREPLLHPARPHRAVAAATPRLTLERVTLHNIRGSDVHVPLGRLVVITGVSGSGKSTPARDARLLEQPLDRPIRRLVARGAKAKADSRQLCIIFVKSPLQLLMNSSVSSSLI